MIARRTILATLMLVLAAGAAQAACPSAPAGYQGAGKESFAAGEGRSVSAEGLQLQTPKSRSAIWASDTRMIDSWACMSFWFPEVKNDSKIAAGLLFWMQDPQNFYMAVARRNGSFGIWRHTAKGWETINSGGLFWFYVNSPQGPLVRTGPGPRTPENSNQIEVITMGDSARVFINDRMVMHIGTNQLLGQTSVGIYAEADAEQDYLWPIESVSIISLCHGDSTSYCY